jgi:hypothetical protein
MYCTVLTGTVLILAEAQNELRMFLISSKLPRIFALDFSCSETTIAAPGRESTTSVSHPHPHAMRRGEIAVSLFILSLSIVSTTFVPLTLNSED